MGEEGKEEEEEDEEACSISMLELIWLLKLGIHKIYLYLSSFGNDLREKEREMVWLGESEPNGEREMKTLTDKPLFFSGFKLISLEREREREFDSYYIFFKMKSFP